MEGVVDLARRRRRRVGEGIALGRGQAETQHQGVGCGGEIVWNQTLRLQDGAFLHECSVDVVTMGVERASKHHTYRSPYKRRRAEA